MDPDGTQYGLATKLRISPVTMNAATMWNHVLPTTRRHQGPDCGAADRGGVVVSVTRSRYLFAVCRWMRGCRYLKRPRCQALVRGPAQ